MHASQRADPSTSSWSAAPPSTTSMDPLQPSSTTDKDFADGKDSPVEGVQELSREQGTDELVQYRLYKRRWAGLAGIALINVVTGLNQVWFAAVFDQTKTFFGISTTALNNLSNALNATLIVTGLFVPTLIQRFGVQKVCWLGAFLSFLGAWLRYAGSQMSNGYGLLVFSYILLGFSTVLVATLGPKFSELWFDERGRTTATAVYSVGSVLGQLISQILSPSFVVSPSDTPFGLLVNAAITTGLCLTCFLVFDAPPTPPTFTASKKTVSALQTVRMVLGLRSKAGDAESIEGRESMTRRQRIDFGILIFAWMIISSNILLLEGFISQILNPVGIDSETAGYMGAVLIGVGIIAALGVGPLFDRVLVNHLAMALRVGTVAVLACFIGLIFAVKPNNEGGIYGLFAVLGATGLTLQPFALELGSEITRSPEMNSMVLQVFAAIWALIATVVMDALVEPTGLRKGLYFLAASTAAATLAAVCIEGKQVRRERDVEMKERSTA